MSPTKTYFECKNPYFKPGNLYFEPENPFFEPENPYSWSFAAKNPYFQNRTPYFDFDPKTPYFEQKYIFLSICVFNPYVSTPKSISDDPVVVLGYSRRGFLGRGGEKFFIFWFWLVFGETWNLFSDFGWFSWKMGPLLEFYLDFGKKRNLFYVEKTLN